MLGDTPQTRKYVLLTHPPLKVSGAYKQATGILYWPVFMLTQATRAPVLPTPDLDGYVARFEVFKKLKLLSPSTLLKHVQIMLFEKLVEAASVAAVDRVNTV
eukprot:3650829-Pleurochrysis_carterae.AAC.1